MFPPDVTKTVAIYHLASSVPHEYPATADVTTSGALLPLDRRGAALEGVAFENQYELYVDPVTDIRSSDKLVIETVTYMVKQVFIGDFGGLAHKRASISREA